MTIISLNVDDCYGRRKTVCLVTWETLYLVQLLGRRLIWFGHSGDAWSGLVTRETLYLVWSLGRRLIWFRHSGDALSDLTHSGGVRGCVMIIFKTLSGFHYSGDVV